MKKPRNPRKPLPASAQWMLGWQVCERYGGRSGMWLHREVHNNPDFPKPTQFGKRLKMFRVADLDAYDRKLILASVSKRETADA